MGLENLKSAFSNIKSFIENKEKTVEEVSSNIKSDITTMVSQYSIKIEPQEVDYMINEKSPGFTANQNNQSPTSLFTGISGVSPNMTFTNNSLYGEGVSIGMYSNLYDSLTKYQDVRNPSNFEGVGDVSVDGSSVFIDTDKYTISNITHPGPVDFQKITSMWTTPLTNLTFPEGFTNEMRSSELAKDFSTTSTDGIDFTNTNLYSAMGWEGTNVNFEGSAYSPSYIPINENGVEWDPTTSYYDSIHTTNAISDIFGGPVNFMSGINSYYTEVNPIINVNLHSGIPGFTISGRSPNTEFNIGGYVFGEGDKGNTKFFRTEIIDEAEVISMISTGTHTDYHNAGITFDDTIGLTPLSPSKWSDDSLETTYYDSIHPINAINDVFQGPVDFMYGLSEHADSLTEGSTYVISGFTKDYKPGLFGGWTEINTRGESKLLSMLAENKVIDEHNYSNIKTSYYTGYVDALNDKIEFPGPVGNFILNWDPLSDSLIDGIPSDDTTLSRTWNPSTDYFDSIHPNNSDQFLTEIDIDNWTLGKDIQLQNGNILKNVTELGKGKLVFDTLYNHDPKEGATGNKYLVNAGGNAQDLKLKTDKWGWDEPFHVSKIPSGDEGIFSELVDTIDDFTGNFVSRALADEKRIAKFLTTPKGIWFIAKQNIMGSFQKYNPFYDPTSTLKNIAFPKEGLGLPLMSEARNVGLLGNITDLFTSTTYTEYLDGRAEESNVKTYAEIDRDHKPLAFDVMGNAVDYINNLVGGNLLNMFGETKSDPAGITSDSGINSKENMQNSMGTDTPLGGLGKGDLKTLFPIDLGSDAATAALDLDLSKNTQGMPFYFKDLRDGARIIFRAYLDGISDTISPSWNSENYIGRSEPVYTYTNSERELQFNLSLFAQTKDELNMIYTKMNRLTSLCYPEYKPLSPPTNINADESNTGGGTGGGTSGTTSGGGAGTETNLASRVMMKAPLVKFRLGELFGSQKAEMTGFIKSLSYTFPDESPWEIQNGYRVPKYVTANIGFQVIHSEVPSLDFTRFIDSEEKPTNRNTFYGINQTIIDKTPGLG